MKTLSKDKLFNEIEEAAHEITELLVNGGCQKYLVLTEVEIILDTVKKLKSIQPEYSDNS